MRSSREWGDTAGRRAGPVLRGLALLLLAGPLAAGLLPGCLFTSRTPNPPLVQGQVTWNAPTDPGILLDNITATFVAKQTANYDRALAGDFLFRPDPVDSTTTGGFCFHNWNKDKELTVFGTLLANKGKVSFSWNIHGSPLTVPDHPDETYYDHVGYKLKFSAPGPDTAFAGKADLYMRQTNGEWQLYKWLDVRSSPDTMTLGRMRCSGGTLTP